MKRIWTIIGVADVPKIARARTLVPALEEEPNINPATGTREFALRDLDGYAVMIGALT